MIIGKTMCICEIYFSQIGFYLAHFHEEIQRKPQTFSGALLQTPRGLCPGLAGGLTASTKERKGHSIEENQQSISSFFFQSKPV